MVCAVPSDWRPMKLFEMEAHNDYNQVAMHITDGPLFLSVELTYDQVRSLRRDLKEAVKQNKIMTANRYKGAS